MTKHGQVQAMALTADSITGLDFELIVYRKGSLYAHVNLVSGYLTWRDSWQWCNNFTRTISREQISQIREQVASCQAWQSSVHSPDTDQSSDGGQREETGSVSWQISIQTENHGQWQARGRGELPACWQPLKSLIEKISRVCFFV